MPKKGEKATQAGREVIPVILKGISEGASMRQLCREHGVALSTFFGWVSEEQWAEHYARAREARADLYFEEIDDISEEAVMAESPVKIAALRLKADNVKWKLARMAPKKYGERQSLDHNGSINLTLFDGEQARRMAQLIHEDQSG